jgi:hypothetical protein
MMNWFLVVRGYQNGQQQMFMLYGERETARRIGRLVDPNILSPKKDYILYEWIYGTWSPQETNSPG